MALGNHTLSSMLSLLLLILFSMVHSVQAQVPSESGKLPTYEQLHKNTAVTMSDLDASLTKAWMFTHRDEPDVRPLFDLTLNHRPSEELYVLRNDPDQLTNIADNAAFAKTKAKLANRLMAVLKKTNDPRLTNAFDRPPYVENN